MGREYCIDQEIKSPSNLADARILSSLHPRVTKLPDQLMIRAIVPEDSVLLSHNGERFWVKVDEVNEVGDHFEFIGKITSGLIYKHPFEIGDCILFNGHNVISIFSHEWKNELRITPNE